MDRNKVNSVQCPYCCIEHVPQGSPLPGGIYSVACLNCQTPFKFRSVSATRDKASVSINGKAFDIGDEVGSDISLNEFIRNVAGFKGTKVMCSEGGCGCCVVNTTLLDERTHKPKTLAVNSCLIPVLACDGWHVTTTEGIGGQKAGFNIIQERIAEYYGSQCGFCTPGMVMNMSGLLASTPKATEEEIEACFDGNLCRCTGYRPILDAMKSFSNGTSAVLVDLEDLGECQKLCKQIGRKTTSLSLTLANSQWFKPTTLPELYNLLDQYKDNKVRLVVGNTATGIYTEDAYDVYIDTKGIADLYEADVNNTNKTITIGANVTLAELIVFFTKVGQSEGFEFCNGIAAHIRKVANVPVRNAASWAGNLMTKYYHPDFPSDLFTLFEAVGAEIVLCLNGTVSVKSLVDFLATDMKGTIVLKLLVHGSTDPNTIFSSYKIMPRSQNAHAYVNAAFVMSVDNSKAKTVTDTPSLVFGGVNKDFFHAKNTEKYLVNKSLQDEVAIQGAFKTLDSEVIPDGNPVSSSPAYRKSLCVSLLYRYFLSILGDELPQRLRSGVMSIERPLSSGTQDFDTDHTQWPVTKALPKITAKLQASGEAEYCQDIPVIPGQLYAAFVVTSVGNAKISSIDPGDALAMPGVEKFISATDIPSGGTNNVWPPQIGNVVEPLFATSQVEYAGQAVGLIVANSQTRANQAAEKVKITYNDVQQPVTNLQEAIAKQMFFPNMSKELKVGDAEAAISKSDKVIVGEVGMGTQYHFTMETQSCMCVPKELLMEVYPTTQWIDGTQSTIAQILGWPNSKIRVEVRRLGGAYGSKLTRNLPVNAACALAAYVTDKPVTMVLSLKTNMQLLGKRFPWHAKYQVGVSKEGKLNGIKITYYNDSGFAATESTYNQIYAFTDNTYYCANWHLNSIAVKTHTPQQTSARSPASLPAIFITESVMEHVAKELNMDPTAFRKMNFYTVNQVTPLGQRLPYFNVDKLLDQINVTADMEKRSSDIQTFNQNNRWKKKGLSMVPLKFNIGWIGGNYGVLLAVYGHDGSVSVAHGGIEMGQGINTKVVQVCAHELDIDPSLIIVRPSSDLANANSVLSGGSVTSELCCLGVQKACVLLKERLTPVRTKMSADTTWKELIQECYKEGVDLVVQYWVTGQTYQPSTQPALYFAYGVMCSEVELDVLTGENQINRVDILYDCGQSVNPMVDIGQIEGAVAMALGYFLHEEIKYDPVSGENLTTGTWEYKIPTSKDIPVDMRISLLKNSPNPVKVIRSKAVAEPPMCMTCSVLFALKHAIDDARREAGNTSYFSAGPPTTVEYAQQNCLNESSMFVIKE